MNLETIDWLLQDDAPSVRYLALRDLLDHEEGDAILERAKDGVMERGPVPRILAAQASDGHWGRPEDFYMRSKYKGTVWNLHILAQLEADGQDERIQRAVDFILQWSQCDNGGFTYMGTPEGGRKPFLHCLTANMAFSMVRFGRLKDERVMKAIDLIAARFAGEEAKTHPKCAGCRSGMVKSLRALVEIPEAMRNTAVKSAIDAYREEILDRCLDLNGTGHRHMRREWLAPSAPLMWNTDLLDILGLLAQLGVHDERMRPGVAHVVGLMNEDGRWMMGKSFNARYLTSIERDGRPSKWVTLHAMVMRKHLSTYLLP